jgi:uncharacterized protein (TIGR02145 family)
MMRLVKIVFLVTIPILSFSQSKKELIEQLNKRLDSITLQLDSERVSNIQSTKDFKLKIKSLEDKILELNTKIDNQSQDLSNKANEISSNQEKIKLLQDQIVVKNDSLANLRAKNGNQKNLGKTQNNPVSKSNNDGVITQIDGFKVVKISTQIWMVENLNVDKFRNGDLIPEARTKDEWEKARKDGQPAWCYYDNDTKNGSINGKLYNWFAINDPRGIAPSGWHIPSQKEWEILSNYLGDDAGKKLKTSFGWNSWDEDVSCTNCKNASVDCKVCKGTGVSGKKINGGNGLNTLNFSGIPSGSRGANGIFSGIGNHTIWWNASENGPEHAGYFGLNNSSNILSGGTYNKGRGLSLRCIRN